MNDTENKSDGTSWWDWVLRGLGLMIALAGSWKIYQLEPQITQGLVLIGLGLIMLILGMQSKLKSYSVSISNLLKLQAETRDVVREARDVTSELRLLSKILGAEVLKLLVGGGRWGGHGSSREVYDRSQELLSHLKTMGLTEEDINEIQSGVSRWHKIDYCGVIADLADAKRKPDSNETWNAFWKEWNKGTERPPPDMLEAWLKENDWFDDEISEWLDDYRHFMETQKHRRPQTFRERDSVLEEARGRRGKR